MFTEYEYLPWSGRRYRISNIGELHDIGGEVPTSVSEEGDKIVELEWVLGKREYKLAVLALIAFGYVKLADHLIDKVEPLYRDGNRSNLAPINLLYRFRDGPLEAENYPGFFHIPFYADYAINLDGDLINVNTGKLKTWSITPTGGPKNQTGGYRYSRVVNDHGFSKTLFQHRALCLVFKRYESNVDDLVCNHLDGDPGNNRIDNLELVTYLRNNLHAVEIGLRGDNKPVMSKNLLTGEIKRFFSRGEAGRHYNRPASGYIYNRLTKSFGKVFPDMLLFKFDDGSPWPEIDLESVKMDLSGGVSLFGRNVFTGDVVLFESCAQAASYTGVKSGTVLSHVKQLSVIPVSGWNFRYMQPGITWPQHNDRLLKIYSKYPIYPTDGAVVYDTVKDVEIFYESVALAMNALAIGKSVYHHYVKNGKLLKNRYRLDIYRIREHVQVSLQSDL